jgi:hypothetical protein
MLNLITTRKLGLAAYLKIKGAQLVEKNPEGFHFESSVKTKKQWEVEYANSEAALFNSALIELNQLNRD